jgi:hypothetical protein
MNKFAVKAWRDCHGVPTLFLVIDEDECELGRFPSEAEAVSKAAALEDENRFLPGQATAASGEVADIFARHRDFLERLPPKQRERLLAEAQDVVAGNNHGE